MIFVMVLIQMVFEDSTQCEERSLGSRRRLEDDTTYYQVWIG